MTRSSLKLSRNRDQTRALFKTLASALVMEESLTTTLTRAKYLTPRFEKLITTAKTQNLVALRSLRRQLSLEAALKMYKELAPRFAKRQGGYTRIKLAGWRAGDNARLARVSLSEAAAPKAAPAAKRKGKVAKTTSGSIAAAKTKSGRTSK